MIRDIQGRKVTAGDYVAGFAVLFGLCMGLSLYVAALMTWGWWTVSATGVVLLLALGVWEIYFHRVHQRLWHKARIGQLEAENGIPVSLDERKCPSCLRPLVVGAKFCTFCGRNLLPDRRQCPKCHTRIPDGGNFCPECRTEISQFGKS